MGCSEVWDICDTAEVSSSMIETIVVVGFTVDGDSPLISLIIGS